MVLDIRAEIICNLGPVISGSVKDDHVQGQGLVMSTGDLVIAGLITPAHGDLVELSYVTPDGVAARFPRGPFYVTQAFANPLSNQTELQIADKLAYEKGKGGGTVNTALVDGLNGREPTTYSVLDLNEAVGLICSRIGVTVNDIGSWSLKQQVTYLESDDYVDSISDILASTTRFGYLDSNGELVAESYDELSDDGPVIEFDQVLDIALNQGGLDYTENPTGEGTVPVPVEPVEDGSTIWTAAVSVTEGSYGSFSAKWTSSTTTNETILKINAKDGTQTQYPVLEVVTTTETTSEPDNRVIERTTETLTSLIKVNSQIVQDYAGSGIIGAPSANDLVSSRKTDYYTYQEIPPPPLTEAEQKQVDEEIAAAQQAIIDASPNSKSPYLGTAGGILLLPELPTYRVIREESSETMNYKEALGRIGIKDYTKILTIPDGEAVKQKIVTDILYTDTQEKRFEKTFVAYGLTQMGQQAIAAAAARLGNYADVLPLLEQFFPLVLEDVVIKTTELPKPPNSAIPSYLEPFTKYDTVIQGTSQIQLGDTPETRSNNSLSFSVPYLPHDIVSEDGTVESGNAETAAADYAEEQNRLLLGHRLGMQVTTKLGVLPTNPLSAFHLSSNGITATYRTNGTAWSFDSNSCIVSTDALYWGVEGEDINGPLWTPVAPGTTALPVPPPVINNGPQPPVNSTTTVSTAEGNVSVSSIVASLATADLSTYQSIVADLFNSLPTGEPEVFEIELQPTALALPFKKISNAALEVRLQVETLLVPNGINRSMGDLDLEWQLQLEAVQQLSSQVRLQLESAERQLLDESLSGGFGMGGNLS
jgi:hypothetical protein